MTEIKISTGSTIFEKESRSVILQIYTKPGMSAITRKQKNIFENISQFRSQIIPIYFPSSIIVTLLICSYNAQIIKNTEV